MKDKIDPFYIAYRGAFTGILKWSDLDVFWSILSASADQGWYVYTTAEAPPHHTLSSEELKHFIVQLDKQLRADHAEDYCGIVYVDSKTEPSYIKVYDPKNLGVVCGIGREPIFPGWILSRLMPKNLDKLPPMEKKSKSWWRRLLPGD